MSREQFVDTFGSLFQGPTWVVEEAYEHRPFSDTGDLRRAFQDALFSGTPEDQAALLGSYPELGAESVATALPDDVSFRDQSALGLTRLDQKDHEELADLTSRYQDRFGFPLIMAVRDRESLSQVLRQGWARLDNSPAQERAAALVETARIAGYRFDDLVADANPVHAARSRMGTFG